LTAVSEVPSHQTGLASALLNTGQQLGGAIGLAVLGTVAISSARRYTSAHLGSTHQTASTALTNSAQTHGFTVAFAVGAVLMALALLVSLAVLRRPARHDPA